MSRKTPEHLKPISDDEFDRLADFLELHSRFDTNGLLGVLHAVAVAPSLLPLSAWLPVVLSGGLGDLGQNAAKALLDLLFRLHGQVLDALHQGQGMVPDPEDTAGCEAFAAGFTAIAEIDPEWIGHAERWSFACPMAYPAGRLDLLARSTIRNIERNLAPDPALLICRHLVALLCSAEEAFREVRKKARAQMATAKSPGWLRVGRNNLCPCGSRKKFKRCCIDSEPELGAP